MLLFEIVAILNERYETTKKWLSRKKNLLVRSRAS